MVKLEFGSFDFYEVRETGEFTGTLITKKMRNSSTLNPPDTISGNGTQATAVEKRALIFAPSLCTLMQFNDKLIHFWKYI